MNDFSYCDYRFLKTKSSPGKYNWAFLPGGPGLGSEYYIPLIEQLDLPGQVWRLDFPGDGSNRLDKPVNYNEWAKNLVPALQQLDSVILVTHSFSGMFTLTIPAVQDCLEAYVIMDSAPDRGWFQNHATFDAKEKAYQDNPNDETFKALVVARWNEFMGDESKDKAIALLSSLPIHHDPYDWARVHFHPTYESKWVPEKIPTLILSGEKDKLTPIKCFKKMPKFHRPNIEMIEIPGASHFPWVENPEAVKDAFRQLM